MCINSKEGESKMKKLLTVAMLVCFVGAFAFAGWDSVGEFPDTTTYGKYMASGHGLAVDPDGKIWHMSYYSADSVEIDTNADGTNDDWTPCRAAYVFNPDGSEASFSPVKIIEYEDGTFDTLLWSGRGMRANADGNIAICNYEDVRLVDYTDGSGISHAKPWPENSVVSPGFDNDNNMFIALVVAGGIPIKAYDADMEFIDDVVSGDLMTGYARTMTVSPDGNDIYFPSYTGGTVVRFHSDAGLDGTYAPADTIFMSTECMDWNPATGLLWMGERNGDAGRKKGSLYAWDTEAKAFVDSCIVPAEILGIPMDYLRGMGFSPDGKTVYITFFANTNACMYAFSQVEGVWEYTSTIAKGYELKQNYPNPFNATTVIPFIIEKDADVKLAVYDMLGNEVRTLVNENVKAGSYNINFDATGLATGMYIYRMETKGMMFSKKMMFVK